MRAAGAGLIPVPLRPDARPELRAEIELDETAGVNFPAPFKVAVTVRGQLAELFRAGALQASKDQLAEMAGKLIAPYLDEPTIMTRNIDFDDAAGTATLHAAGVAYPDWDKENERYRDLLDRAVTQLNFQPDRTAPGLARHPGRDREPAQFRDPHEDPPARRRHRLHARRQPDPVGHAGRHQGRADDDAGRWLGDHARTSLMSTGAEIAVADIGAERQRLDQAKQHLLRVVAPADYAAPYQIVAAGKKAKRFDAILAQYKQGIADDPAKAEPYRNRAWFLERIYDRGPAIEDLTRAIAIDPSVDIYLWRARLYEATGDKAKALDDINAARKVDPASGRGDQPARLAARRRWQEGSGADPARPAHRRRRQGQAQLHGRQGRDPGRQRRQGRGHRHDRRRHRRDPGQPGAAQQRAAG